MRHAVVQGVKPAHGMFVHAQGSMCSASNEHRCNKMCRAGRSRAPALKTQVGSASQRHVPAAWGKRPVWLVWGCSRAGTAGMWWVYRLAMRKKACMGKAGKRCRMQSSTGCREGTQEGNMQRGSIWHQLELMGQQLTAGLGRRLTGITVFHIIARCGVVQVQVCSRSKAVHGRRHQQAATLAGSCIQELFDLINAPEPTAGPLPPAAAAAAAQAAPPHALLRAPPGKGWAEGHTAAA